MRAAPVLAVVGAATGLLLMIRPAPAPAQPTTFVLVDCEAHARASVLETSSILDARGDLCLSATWNHGAWQAQLLSHHGDVARVATIEQGVWDPSRECSGGPFGDLPAVLSLYVPEDSIVPTVAEDLRTKTRDGREAVLKPGVPLQHVKGPWYRVQASGEAVEVKVPKKHLATEFTRPPKGVCATVEPPQPADDRLVELLLQRREVKWVAPAESSVFLPTREEIGVTTAEFELLDETYSQGPLRCTTVTPLGFADQGPAPLCFLELALNRR